MGGEWLRCEGSHSQTQHGLHTREQRRNIERLEKDLGRDVPVRARVQGGLGEEDGVLCGVA